IINIAVEFAKSKPATIFSHNGLSWHKNGISSEKACLLLAMITGNIDNEGGICLPRQFNVAEPQPAPKSTEGITKTLNYSFPFEVNDGKRKVQILFNHMSNPVYSAPAASVWREILQDEKLIPYIVDFSPFMSETSELADLILPDVVDVERDNVASSPTALWPWLTMTIPNIEPLGKAQDVRMSMKQIVEAIDPTGEKGMKQYWTFTNTKQWVKDEIKATPDT
ncbi:MAG: hypothetical protein IMF12_09090, partial [Proteobacteria bacterium]|nr:hypothetical protein [Pseudomonadota bacterium]